MVGSNYTNSLGTVEFSDLDPGQYEAIVSGEGIETASSGSIEVNDWNIFQSKVLVIRNSTVKTDNKGQPTVVAADLSVPPKAAKEYNHGNDEMTHKNWQKAIERFNKAIEIYPSFSAAYNNLAVCYGRLGQRDQKRKTLEKVLSVNDRFVPAMLNLSDMDIQTHNYSEASSLLEKALKVEPSNVEALSYLAQLYLAQGQYELATATVRTAHSLPHQNFATVHFTSASAFEHEGHTKEAIAELQIFLQEAPQSPNAEAARKAIAGLQSRAQ